MTLGTPLRRAALCLAAVALLAACGRRGKSVKIAVVVPLTGDVASEGQGLRRGVELAVEEANAAKRFPFKVEVAPFDDRADPKEAVSAANLVVGDPSIVASIAHYNSGCAIPAAKIYARAPMAMITPAATNPEVTAQQLKPDWTGPRVAFRICPTDEGQAAYAAWYIRRKLGKSRVAVIDDKTAYGHGLTEEFQKRLEALSGTVSSSDGVAVGDKDFKALLTRLHAAHPDAVYFGGLYPEAGLIVRQMRELGMKAPFFTSDGSRTSGFFEVAGPAADGAYITIGGLPVELLPTGKAFIDAYKKRWGDSAETLRPYDHYGYEAAGVVLDALAKAGPDRMKVLSALYETKHEGVLGLTTFDEKGDAVGRKAGMTRARVKDRSFPIVE